MDSILILVAVLIYGAIALGHFSYLYYAAKRIGYGKDSGRLTFVGVCSLFWPITWIWYLIDSLRRGRVA